MGLVTLKPGSLKGGVLEFDGWSQSVQTHLFSRLMLIDLEVLVCLLFFKIAMKLLICLSTLNLSKLPVLYSFALLNNHHLAQSSTRKSDMSRCVRVLWVTQWKQEGVYSSPHRPKGNALFVFLFPIACVCYLMQQSHYTCARILGFYFMNSRWLGRALWARFYLSLNLSSNWSDGDNSRVYLTRNRRIVVVLWHIILSSTLFSTLWEKF